MDVRIINASTGAVVQEFNNAANGVVSSFFLSNTASGAVTYKIQVRCRSGISAGSGFAFARAMFSLNLKR